MRSAFTIIELLVVITIIAVLLALLMPALDQAVYQAELSVCAARLSAIGSSTMTYLTDARWNRGGTPKRGTEDLNYGFDDGSVLRFDKVRWNEPQLSNRMVEVPTDLSDASTAVFGFRDQVPVR